MNFAATKKRLHTVEKREARMAVGPFLQVRAIFFEQIIYRFYAHWFALLLTQAEHDVVMDEKIRKLLKEETEIMKDRKEWDAEKTQRFR